ncbi:hypothetical protein VTK56DRAFT_5356 [Thermocarpiscus australiensis]
MGSSSNSGDHGVRDASRLRESVSMVIRQFQSRPLPSQAARARSEEIPESEEEEVPDENDREHGNHTNNNNDDNSHDDDGNDDRDEEEEEDGDDGDYGELPGGRHSISSAGSNYSPPAASSEGEGVYPDNYSLHAEPDTQGEDLLSAPRQTYSSVPPTPTQPGLSPSGRKRSLFPPPSPPGSHPFKRRKGAFNHAYLALLNEDIQDAATRFTPHDWGTGSGSGTGPARNKNNAVDDNLLPASQIGLTYWTSAEKALFFEALARLGRDDAAGIAARIRTKSELEVAAYMALLRDAAEGSKKTTTIRKWERRDNRRAAPTTTTTVPPAELPAAVELSQACCAALEEAADALALRQEAHEEAAERRRWGGGEHWLIGPWNLKEVEREPPEGLSPSVGFFWVRNWLRLAERVFMNAAVEEHNWASVSPQQRRPAVRATALEDFYALAVSVTRRLVAATIYVAESRVRAKRVLDPLTRRRVYRQDVEAAALSLGLPTNSRRFWARSARRLRLDVYDEEEGDVAGWDGEGRDEQAPTMSYDEVERALGFEPENPQGDGSSDERRESSEEAEESDDGLVSLSDTPSIDLDAEITAQDASDQEQFPSDEEDEAEKESVKREMDELMVHSALEFPKSTRARNALKKRIRAARAHEAYADALDARASYYEEKRLWAMLERSPPVELTRVEVPEEPPKWSRGTVEDLIRGVSRTPGAGDWRSKLEVVPSRWEMEYALVEQEKKTGGESGHEN